MSDTAGLNSDLTISIGELAAEIESRLTEASVADARDEARDLVAVLHGERRFWPRMNADAPASADLVMQARQAASKRSTGMPFAYAVGRAAFRYLTLTVSERVLIPRQETEVLVDLVLKHRPIDGGVVADVGTGTGAIALALSSEGRFDRVIATDVSGDALTVARKNAADLAVSLRAPVEFRAGDLLAPLQGERLDVLVSNPPYIAYDEAVELPASVRNWEPSLALFSGSHGLDATRRIIAGAPALLSTGGLLALEVDSRRALQVAEVVASNGKFARIEVCQDLVGRDRFVLALRI